MDLRSNDGKRNALISSLGRACAEMLRLRFPCAVDTHTLSPRERALALKNGRTFAQLILEDGACADAFALGGIERALRLQDETDAFVQRATSLCESMHVLLVLLQQFCLERPGEREVINMIEIAAPRDDPEETFFVELEFVDGNRTGRLTRALADAVAPAASAWLLEYEKIIRETFDLGPDEDEDYIGVVDDEPFSRRVRRELTTLIADHVALHGLFDTQLRKREHALRAESVAALRDRLLSPSERRRCEARRQASLDDLRCLLAFCGDWRGAARDGGSAYETAVAMSTRLERAIANPPPALRDRAGFDSAVFRLDELASIAAAAAATGDDAAGRADFDARFADWRAAVGRCNMATMHDCLSAAVEIVAAQVVDFLPTLAICKPPSPTWTDDEPLADSYARSRTSRSRRAAARPPTRSRRCYAYTPMSADAQAGVRLLSAVWECLGDGELYAIIFAPGRVRCRLLETVVRAEQIKLNRALFTLRACAQHAKLGSNYRNATRRLDRFRDSPRYEMQLREIVRLLAPFSLNDIMSVAHDASPLFLMFEYKIVDRTLSSLSGEARGCAQLVRQALHFLCPVVRDLRCEAALDPSVSSNCLIDGLMSLPAVRAWDRGGDELVLTGVELDAGLAGVRAALLKLSNMQRLVHFGRRPSRDRNVYGNQRVFTFNGPDLRALFARTFEIPSDELWEE